MYLGKRTVISFAALNEFAELQVYLFHAVHRQGSSSRPRKRHLHVSPQGSQSKREGHEERSGSVRPFVDEIQWVPQKLPIVEDHRCAGDRDTDEPEESKRDWDNSKLNVLALEAP